MPIYDFLIEDAEGPPRATRADLPDLAAARAEALRLAGAAHDHEGFWNGSDWHLTAADSRGMTLFSLTLFAVSAPCTSRAAGAKGGDREPRNKATPPMS
jgi:hypothetical protein